MEENMKLSILQDIQKAISMQNVEISSNVTCLKNLTIFSSGMKVWAGKMDDEIDGKDVNIQVVDVSNPDGDYSEMETSYNVLKEYNSSLILRTESVVRSMDNKRLYIITEPFQMMLSNFLEVPINKTKLFKRLANGKHEPTPMLVNLIQSVYYAMCALLAKKNVPRSYKAFGCNDIFVCKDDEDVPNFKVGRSIEKAAILKLTEEKMVNLAARMTGELMQSIKEVASLSAYTDEFLDLVRHFRSHRDVKQLNDFYLNHPALLTTERKLELVLEIAIKQNTGFFPRFGKIPIQADDPVLKEIARKADRSYNFDDMADVFRFVRNTLQHEDIEYDEEIAIKYALEIQNEAFSYHHFMKYVELAIPDFWIRVKTIYLYEKTEPKRSR